MSVSIRGQRNTLIHANKYVVPSPCGAAQPSTLDREGDNNPKENITLSLQDLTNTLGYTARMWFITIQE